MCEYPLGLALSVGPMGWCVVCECDSTRRRYCCVVTSFRKDTPWRTMKDSSSLIDDPRWHFGAGAEGEPRSYNQWIADCCDANGDSIWPYEGDGAVRDGMDRATVETFWGTGEYLEKYGPRMDRVGGPRGAYLFGVDAPRPVVFAERSLEPAAAKLPHHRYRLTGQELPPAWRIETGRVVPAVGGRGGGRQVLFRDAGKGLLSVEELLETGLLEEVRERA